MDTVFYQHVAQNYLAELRNGQQGNQSSLAFIRNRIPEQPLVQANETFQVLVIGGSNFLSAIVKKEHESLVIISSQDAKLPVFTSEATFLSFILGFIDPSIRYLAVNFAFAVIPEFTEGILDGKIFFGSKEHTFSGMEGKLIGQTIADYVAQQRRQIIRVSIANDTICLLLSGLTQKQKQTYAAGIVGTGMNFAFFEDKQTAINLESGGFAKFEISQALKEVDKTTERPGEWLFEKEISGRYLYELFNWYLQVEHLNYPKLNDSALLSDIASGNDSKLASIVQQLFQRSAYLIASACVAITQFSEHDLEFVMQGSVFWKGYHYQQYVQEAYSALLPGKEFTYFKVEHADILGAAKLIA